MGQERENKLDFGNQKGNSVHYQKFSIARFYLVSL